MQQFIYDEYDELEVSIGCIRYILDCERWTRKATQDQALKQSVQYLYVQLSKVFKGRRTKISLCF
jgi:hypothetical protein